MLIAHLSDLHLIEPDPSFRTTFEKFRLSAFNGFRKINPEQRRKRALLALQHAKKVGADFVVITGDLTEDGHPLQFVVLKEVLEESGFRSDQIMIIPGNHDIYHDFEAFNWAIAKGPLKPWHINSTCEIAFDAVRLKLVPVWAIDKPLSFFQEAGHLAPGVLSRISEIVFRDYDHGVVLVSHHPPKRSEGCTREAEFLRLLVYPHVQLVHGHTHREQTVANKVFGVEATSDGKNIVRFYKVENKQLKPFDNSSSHLIL